MMAKTLDVKTINGSLVTENTAGIESNAKITSVVSTKTRTMKSGVTHNFLSILTTK